MKARALKKELNDTSYIIADYGKYIGVGSPYVHNLISVDKETLKIKYALDIFHKGRAAINNEELLFIWDKLHEIVESGEMRKYFDGKDDIDLNNLVKVYTYDSKQGEVIESYSEELGWPNITIDGILQHSNTYFSSAKEAKKDGLRDLNLRKENISQSIEEAEREQEKRRKDLIRVSDLIEKLETYKP